MDREENPLPARGQPRLVGSGSDVIGAYVVASGSSSATSTESGASCCSAGSSIPRRGGGGEEFLTALAVKSNVASSTQNHSPDAVVFL